MAKVTTDKGVILDTDGGFSKTATLYAREKGLSNIICVLETHPDGDKEYLLLESTNGKMEPIYSNKNFESIGIQIDIIALDKSFKD